MPSDVLITPASSKIEFTDGANATKTLKITGTSLNTDTSFAIGATTANNTLSVLGSASIGSSYNVAGPTNGLIVQGSTGIGTTSPTTLLQLRQVSATHQIFSINRANSATPALFLGNDSSDNALIASNNTALRFGKDFTGTFNEYVRIDTNGNVGIGTTSPGVKLDVIGGIRSFSSAGNYGLITNGSFQAVGDHGGTFMLDLDNTGAADLVNIKKSGTSRFYIKNDGNVGIGATSPIYKLEVIGDARISGGIINPSLSAQWTLSGGGTVTYNGSAILWSNRVITIPVEKDELSTTGYIDINCPTSGTITYYNSGNGISTVTCAASGIPIGIWEALYYEITPGQTQASDQTKFRLVNYQNSTWRPSSNWLLICAVNGDASSLKWIPGQVIIPTNGSFDSSNSTNNWQIAGTTNYIAKFTSANKVGNSVLYDNGANIGVGTASPAYKLDVSGIIASVGSPIAWFSGNYNRIYEPAGNPALYLGNNSDPTNYYDNSTHYFRSRGGGTNYAIITSSGNVGIGTSNPAAKLDIVGTNTTIALSFGTTVPNNPLFINTYGGYAGVGMDQTTAGIRLAGDYSGGTNPLVDIGYYTSGSVSHANWISRLKIINNGNVGIGSTLPAYKLDVAGRISYNGAIGEGADTTLSSSGTVLLHGNSATWTEQRFYTSGTQKATINTSGNLGIGTTTVSYKLHVQGDIYARSAVTNTSTDLNSLRGNVTTMGYSLTNSPSGAGWITVYTSQNFLSSGDILSQLAYDNYNQQKLFTRYSADYGATWSAWKTIINSDALSGTTNYIPKFTGTNSIGNSLIFDNGTNVAIGSNAVAYGRLQISATGTSPSLSSTNPTDASLIISNSDIAYGTMFATYGDGKGALQQRRTNAATYYDFSLQPHGGNLGIGTLSPTQKLEVAGIAMAGSGSYRTSIYGDNGGAYLYFGTTANASALGQIGAYGALFNINSLNNDISFQYNSSEKMRITTSGNVGIGTTTPSYKLHVSQAIPTGTTSAPANTSIQVDSNTNNYLSFVNTADNGTYAGLTFVDNNVGGYIVFRNYTGDVSTGSDSLIYGTYQDHIFQTGTTSGINSRNEVMRIKNGGNVGIGVNAPNNKLHVNGSMSIGSSYNTAGPTDGLIVQGNVGIGMTTTNYKLNVSTSAAQGFTLTTNNSTVGGPQIDLYDATRAEETVISSTDSVTVGTYIASYSNHPLLFGTYAASSPTAKMAITVSGNVGIGTKTPTAKLHVNSTTSGDTLLRADGTNGTLFSVVDDLSDSLMSVNNSAGLPVLEVFADDRVVMGQYGTNDFVLRNNKVGVGNTNPIYKLDVYDSTNADVGRFYNNNATCNFYIGSTNNTTLTDLIMYTSTGNFQLFKNRSSSSWGGVDSTNFYSSNGAMTFHPSGTTNALYLASNGNIGVNSTSPNAKLHIIGATNTDAGVRGGTVHIRDSTASSSPATAGMSGVVFSSSPGTDWAIGKYWSGTTSRFVIKDAGSAIGTNLLSIDANGNVGIGVDSPSALLQIGTGTPTAATGGIQFGGDTSARLYRSASGIITCSGTIAATFSGNLTGNVTGNVSGTAGGETLGTVTGRGASTSNQISVATSAGGSMYTGTKVGTSYGDGISGATFKSITDNPNGGSYAFAAYYNGVAGTNSFYVSADGTGYFKSLLTTGSISTGAITAAVIKGDSGADYPHSFTNTDSGNTHWTNRGGRLLTSNGANWQTDGRDPIMALVTSGNTNNLNIANSIGLALHNESQTNNTFSPAIAFSNLSNSGSYNTTYAAIIGRKTGQGIDTNWSAGELHFYTMPVGGYVNNIPSLLINSAGNVGIGTTTPAALLQIGTGTPTSATGGIQFGDDTGARIYRGGAGYIQTSGGLQVGNYFFVATYVQTGSSQIYPANYSATLKLGVGNPSSNAWIDGLTLAPGGNVVVAGTLTESSSIRYKENIETISAPILPKLNQIRPVTYNKKDNPKHIEYGIIAEELNELFPEFVNKNESGEVESVNYSRLTVILIKAVKELQEEVEKLKNK